MGFLKVDFRLSALGLLFRDPPKQSPGGYRKWSSQSIHLSVHPRAFLHDGWMDYPHIGYHDHVPWATDACKIDFGSGHNRQVYVSVKSLEFIDPKCNEMTSLLHSQNVWLYISGELHSSYINSEFNT